MRAETIALTGKGGVGKTTVAALTIKHLKEHAQGPILALDADPDANLATVLSIPVEMTVGDMREETLRAMKDFPAGMSKDVYIQAGLHQVIVETPKVDLITMGRGEGPGCYCFVNHLLRKFHDELLSAYEWVVMDNEAGLEHLSRWSASSVDHMIVVVNENPLSTDCARRVDQLLDELGRPVRHRYYVINAAREERIEPIQARLVGLKLEYLGAVPRDDALDEAVFRGQSLYDLDNTPAVRAIAEMMEKIREGQWKSPTSRSDGRTVSTR